MTSGFAVSGTRRSRTARAAALIVAGILLLVVACTGAARAPAAGTPGEGASSGTPAAGAAAEPVASTAALATAALPKAKFTAGAASVTLPIEVPPDREYHIGLSGRRSLEGRGMLFAFPDGTDTGFWMKGTHIDLDIAFVDASMRVIDIQTMRAEKEDIHRASARYVAAVEAPAGWYAANGVKAGAQAAFDVDLRAATGR